MSHERNINCTVEITVTSQTITVKSPTEKPKPRILPPICKNVTTKPKPKYDCKKLSEMDHCCDNSDDK